ncbi:MAG: oligosaccharide flippase family protein [Acholeplasmatales bacterium]|nr:oligosaccharide flippase family protein [Acholeplasmatales bacterium]
MEEAIKPVKEKSIKKNYIYNLIYKLFAVLVPILITPYLSRVLDADGNGVISFVSSIVSYFILASNVGIETYGQRMISIHRNDKAYLKKFMFEVTLMRTILTLVCLGIYYAVFVGGNAEDRMLYAIYGISLFAVTFDFTWFFQGVEDFKILALTGIISKIIYIILLFQLVTGRDDIHIAAGLAIMSTALPHLMCVPFAKKYIGGKIEGKINPFRHFKECMVYFIPTIAVQIYTVVDRTMIGLITNSDFENGYYEQAEKLIKMPLAIITSLNIIVRARISYLYSIGEENKIKKLIDNSANFAFMLAIPMMFGMLAVAKTLVPVYLGYGYDKCITLIYVFAPIILAISVSNLLGTHYYTPFGMQKKSNIFLITGAIINVILNSFLIYYLKSIGAAIASVTAETIIAILYVYNARKFVPILHLLKISVKYLIAGIVMFIAVYLLDQRLSGGFVNLVIEMLFGVVLYFVVLLLLRTRYLIDFIKSIFAKIRRR